MSFTCLQQVGRSLKRTSTPKYSRTNAYNHRNSKDKYFQQNQLPSSIKFDKKIMSQINKNTEINMKSKPWYESTTYFNQYLSKSQVNNGPKTEIQFNKIFKELKGQIICYVKNFQIKQIDQFLGIKLNKIQDLIKSYQAQQINNLSKEKEQLILKHNQQIKEHKKMNERISEQINKQLQILRNSNCLLKSHLKSKLLSHINQLSQSLVFNQSNAQQQNLLSSIYEYHNNNVVTQIQQNKKNQWNQKSQGIISTAQRIQQNLLDSFRPNNTLEFTMNSENRIQDSLTYSNCLEMSTDKKMHWKIELFEEIRDILNIQEIIQEDL